MVSEESRKKLAITAAVAPSLCLYSLGRDLRASAVNTGFGIWTFATLGLCITCFSFTKR